MMSPGWTTYVNPPVDLTAELEKQGLDSSRPYLATITVGDVTLYNLMISGPTRIKLVVSQGPAPEPAIAEEPGEPMEYDE